MWTWLNEDMSHEEFEEKNNNRTLIDVIAGEIFHMERAAEQERFTRDDRELEEADIILQNISNKLVSDRLKYLNAELNKLGARMMRPYEHWNEDEAYMQYMEVDRFG